LQTSKFDFSKRLQTTPPKSSPPRNDDLPWRDWLTRYAPGYVGAGFAPHHEAFWRWAWEIAPDVRPAPFIAIWPRGGGKSTSTELMTATTLLRSRRRYALYVSGTQDQADKHVEAIGAILERLGVERSVNRYGASRGWRRNRLRAAGGFTVDAFGLDTGARGTKDDDARPDLVVFDDLDGIHDTPKTVRRKIETLTMTVLPAAVPHAAIVGVQNLIHAHGIFAQLADGRADWLRDRIISGPTPAVEGCTITPRGDGTYAVAGSPTWQGMNLDACAALVNRIGPDAFRRESQHEVNAGALAIYPTIPTCARFAVPDEWPRYVGLDFGGVHTCAVVLAKATDGVFYVIAVYLAGDRTAAQHAAHVLGLCPGGEPFCVGGSKSEDQWRREFRMGGLPVTAPQFSEVEIGIDRVRGAFEDGAVVIFDDLTPLLAELRTYQRAPDAEGKPTSEILNKATYHHADALRYIVGRVRV
jgi:hypothetical protein